MLRLWKVASEGKISWKCIDLGLNHGINRWMVKDIRHTHRVVRYSTLEDVIEKFTLHSFHQCSIVHTNTSIWDLPKIIGLYYKTMAHWIVRIMHIINIIFQKVFNKSIWPTYFWCIYQAKNRLCIEKIRLHSFDQCSIIHTNKSIWDLPKVIGLYNKTMYAISHSGYISN